MSDIHLRLFVCTEGYVLTEVDGDFFFKCPKTTEKGVISVFFLFFMHADFHSSFTVTITEKHGAVQCFFPCGFITF